jgi:hypothetical protein
MSDYYKLEGKTLVPTDLMTWAMNYDKGGNRVIGYTEFADGVYVSTVFLGMNHQYGDGPPLLFETMVFGGEFDQEQERYSTYEEAEAGHARWVAAVKGEG